MSLMIIYVLIVFRITWNAKLWQQLFFNCGAQLLRSSASNLCKFNRVADALTFNHLPAAGLLSFGFSCW